MTVSFFTYFGARSSCRVVIKGGLWALSSSTLSQPAEQSGVRIRDAPWRQHRAWEESDILRPWCSHHVSRPLLLPLSIKIISVAIWWHRRYCILESSKQCVSIQIIWHSRSVVFWYEYCLGYMQIWWEKAQEVSVNYGYYGNSSTCLLFQTTVAYPWHTMQSPAFFQWSEHFNSIV